MLILINFFIRFISASKILISLKITVTYTFYLQILLAALSIGTKTYFSSSSFKYSITASCFNTGFFLWTFIRCLREIILLSTSWRIFPFQSTNSSTVALRFAETIRSMLESKPISISVLHFSSLLTLLQENWDLYLQARFWKGERGNFWWRKYGQLFWLNLSMQILKMWGKLDENKAF